MRKLHNVLRVYFCFTSLFVGFIEKSHADLNLHKIDVDEVSGFSIYRLGVPKKIDMRLLCQMGITEIMVLSGDAEDVEYKNQNECPQLKVIYNIKQESEVPLDASFLQFFDQWVEDAKLTGKKIAFRCQCGCHRTGRLAAYYNMKYLNWSADEAIDDMNGKGKLMRFYKHLIPQVRDLRDYIDGVECQQENKYCVSR